MIGLNGRDGSAPVILLLCCVAALRTTTTTALVLPPPLPEAASFTLNVNAPAILESVRTKEGRAATLEKLNFLSQSAKFLVGNDNVSIDPPVDTKLAIKAALQGSASVTVNTGLEKIPSQQLDVQILHSDWGVITVQIRNPLLPKLPMLLPKETPEFVSSAVSDAVTAVGSVAQRVMEKAGEESPPPFWTTPIRDGNVVLYGGHAITPLDILGSTSLVMGVVYGKSYEYYLEQQELEQREAEERKKAAAAKPAQAAKTVLSPPKVKKMPTDTDNPTTKMKKVADDPKFEKKESTEKSKLTKVGAEVSLVENSRPSPTDVATAAVPVPVSRSGVSPALALPDGPPQLQRSVASIALPKEKEEPEFDDDLEAKPKRQAKKKGGMNFLRRLINLFRAN
jgi:hypothetical protein